MDFLHAGLGFLRPATLVSWEDNWFEDSPQKNSPNMLLIISSLHSYLIVYSCISYLLITYHIFSFILSPCFDISCTISPDLIDPRKIQMRITGSLKYCTTEIAHHAHLFVCQINNTDHLSNPQTLYCPT